jgi:hypothetical protein
MMVHDYDDASLLLVLQIDHSRVAGLLAAHWGNAEFAAPVPYASVVLAAQEHDSGWWNWEIKPTLNAQGFPPDYHGFWMHPGGEIAAGVVEDSDERARAWISFYRDGIDRVREQDPYAGLLVLMHGTGLLSRGHGVRPNLPDMREDPTAQKFLADRDGLRQDLLAELRRAPEYRDYATDERIWENFKLLEVLDQLAQFICNRYPFNKTSRKTGPRNQIATVPVRAGKPDTTIHIDVLDDKRAVFTPYPFDVDPLEVSFQGRVLPKQPYVSRTDFLRDFYRAPRVNVTYALHAP